MKPFRVHPYLAMLIAGLAIVGLFNTVTGLAGGPPTPGVWHVIGDVSRDLAGTQPFLPIKYVDVDPNEICAENPSNGNPTAACPTGSASSTIDLVNVLRPSGVSVDVDDDGQIDLIDGDTVNSAKIVNGSIAKVDVDEDEICVHTNGIPSDGCGKGPQHECVNVYNQDGSGIITMPSQCGSGEDPAKYGGGCSISITLHTSSSPSPVAYAHAIYAQYDPDASLGGNAHWSALQVLQGLCDTPSVAQGTNGDGTTNTILQFFGGLSPCTVQTPGIQLQDDGGSDNHTYQWRLVDNASGHQASVWVC